MLGSCTLKRITYGIHALAHKKCKPNTDGTFRAFLNNSVFLMYLHDIKSKHCRKKTKKRDGPHYNTRKRHNRETRWGSIIRNNYRIRNAARLKYKRNIQNAVPGCFVPIFSSGFRFFKIIKQAVIVLDKWWEWFNIKLQVQWRWKPRCTADASDRPAFFPAV